MRIANAMFMRPALEAEPVTLSPAMTLVLAVTGIATVYIGVFPDWFIRAVNWSMQAPAAGIAMLR